MSGEGLLIPEIPEPHDGVGHQLPTKDIPTNKGLRLNSEDLARSSNTPGDVQRELESLSQLGEIIDGG